MGAKQLDPDYAGEDFTDRQARSVKGVDVLTLSDRPVSLSDAMRACIDDALTARGKLPTRKPAEGEAPFDPWAEVDAVWDLSDDDAAARHVAKMPREKKFTAARVSRSEKSYPHSYQIPPCVGQTPGTRQRKRRRDMRRRGGR